jgi:phage host-nuclease inhibitor protein Gam
MLDRIKPQNRFGVGGNNPPDMIAFAQGTMTAVGKFLADHPVIRDEMEAKEAKLLKDRADDAVKDMETERDGLVRPLNEKVAAINGRYRPVRDPLEKIIKELRSRLTKYSLAEEAKREAIAEAARAAAAEAERIAREAEEREREAALEAASGVLDVDIAAATITADAAFAEFERADRTAARADRDTRVRITGGYRNAVSLKTHEVLSVTDWRAAIEEMGLTEPLRDAILTAARAYRKLMGELPDGIAATQERTV